MDELFYYLNLDEIRMISLYLDIFDFSIISFTEQMIIMRNKALIYCFLILSTFIAESQSIPPEDLQRFDFSNLEESMSTLNKLALLNKIAYNKYLLPQKFTSSSNYDYENHHFFDFNGDGLTDIVYDGRNPSGIESNNVVFFLNRGDSLIPVIKLLGDFTQLIIENQQLVSFQLITSPCCADFIYSIKDFTRTFDNECFNPKNGNHSSYRYSYGEINNPLFCVSLVSKVHYTVGTEFPAAFETSDSMMIKNETYLTPKPATPSRINFDDERIEFQLEENKAISKLQKGLICQVLASKEVNHKTYCFVIIVNPSKEKNYIRSNNDPTYGWVPKKDLIKKVD